MTIFKTGDAVVIGYDGRREVGRVRLASPNGLSLMLEFEAVLCGYLGTMPVIGDDRGGYRDLLFGRPITLERQQ